MTITNYPDGSSLTSTALSDAQIQTAFQVATAQMLGIVTAPTAFNFTLKAGLEVGQTDKLPLLYQGELVVGLGIPLNTRISGVGPGNNIFLSNAPTVTGVIPVTITDPDSYSKVRIGWQLFGQPGPPIDSDTVTIRCEPLDTEFSRLRDNVLTTAPDLTATYTDVFTRTWRAYWTFYGPTSLDHARMVRSALIKIPLFTDLLAQSNLFINPSIEEPRRVPEDFQGQWWERVDLVVELNEQVTETFTVGTVQSVEVQIFNESGLDADFTVTAPE